MCINLNGETLHKAEGYKVFSLKDGKLYSAFLSSSQIPYKVGETIYRLKDRSEINTPRFYFSSNQANLAYVFKDKHFFAFPKRENAHALIDSRDDWNVYQNRTLVVRKVLLWDVYYGSMYANGDSFDSMIGSSILIYDK